MKLAVVLLTIAVVLLFVAIIGIELNIRRLRALRFGTRVRTIQPTKPWPRR